eukprot:TRINITY_DN2956_c0_g4_i1.p1 TRINITY_DN2956_c0_g4~~TRINITY_DN2956_c0_g4_i1.p1  ORF type:complete len:803 (+),score=217.31 TRINITY_DN2956_c0_g4_i1:240-2411(+)
MEDDEYDPSEQEITEYCEWLGMDIEKEKALTWIAREALKAPLPEYWKICYTEDREVYYFNMRTGESIWDHPMDAYYKSLFKQEKAKLEKKRKKMRLFSGSMPIVPLQTLFSDLSEDDWALPIPETLCDPIDFTLFVDPVVLPTSGRTVSKHTIVNNRWRDPFSREYVENRRLIHNVDKRHEVDAWLAKALAAYFTQITYPPELVAWAASPSSVSVPPEGQYDFANGLAVVMKILPYLLDKEEEVCLEGQRNVLKWMETAYNIQETSEASSTGRRKRTTQHRVLSDVKASRHPCIAEVVNGLQDTGALLSPLLTMSTSASLETLALLLSYHPSFRAHPCFSNFSPEVLNVLQLAEPDVSSMATYLQSLPFPHKTNNTDHLVKMKFLYIVLDSPRALNVLSEYQWSHAFPIVCAAFTCLPATPDHATLAIRQLRGLDGWPCNVKGCPVEVVKWMVSLGMTEGVSAQQRTLLLYDILVSAGEVVMLSYKKNKDVVLKAILESAGMGPRDMTYAAMLGSILVFNEISKIEEFSRDQMLQMHIANALLPRLTRFQWRPKHFEATLKSIIGLLSNAPLAGWGVFKADRIEFLLKELCKKKKNCSELRVKLETLEATEKRLQQSYAINSWLILATKLRKEKHDKASARRQDIIIERMANLVTIMTVLLNMRLKPKVARRPEVPDNEHTPHYVDDVEKQPQAPGVTSKRPIPTNKADRDTTMHSSVTLPPI